MAACICDQVINYEQMAEALLELAVIPDQKREFEKTDLTRTIDDVKELLKPQLIESNAILEVGNSFQLTGTVTFFYALW